MLERLSRVWTFEKQKNVLLRIVAIVSLVFGGVYLTLAIISCFQEPWTWIMQISPTIQLLRFEVIGWRIDRIILIITGGLITTLLVKEVGKNQEESVPSAFINLEEIVDIVGVFVMICFIIWETFQTIVKLFILWIEVPEPYTEGVLFLGMNIGSKDIVIFLSIFCALFFIQTVADIIKKKFSKKNNSLFLIMFVFFAIILIAYSIEEVWSMNFKQIYITDYFLKTTGYLWVGITSLLITKKERKS